MRSALPAFGSQAAFPSLPTSASEGPWLCVPASRPVCPFVQRSRTGLRQCRIVRTPACGRSKGNLSPPLGRVKAFPPFFLAGPQNLYEQIGYETAGRDRWGLDPVHHAGVRSENTAGKSPGLLATRLRGLGATGAKVLRPMAPLLGPAGAQVGPALAQDVPVVSGGVAPLGNDRAAPRAATSDVLRNGTSPTRQAGALARRLPS